MYGSIEAALIRERLDSIEEKLTYIMDLIMAGAIQVSIDQNPDGVGVEEMREVVCDLADEAGYIMGKYLDDLYKNKEENDEN